MNQLCLESTSLSEIAKPFSSSSICQHLTHVRLCPCVVLFGCILLGCIAREKIRNFYLVFIYFLYFNSSNGILTLSIKESYNVLQ